MISLAETRGPRCLVTGGGGFLGSHIVDSLLKRGSPVRVLDRRGADSPNLVHLLGRIEIVAGDINNTELLRKSLQGVDYLFHYASSTTPASSSCSPIEDISSNLIATLQLLAEATQCGVKKVVFPSSGGTIYGPSSPLPIPETHPTNPLSSYGIVKLATEKYLELFRHHKGLDYVALRYGNLYGERQVAFQQFGVIPTFLGRLAKGQTLEVLGDGSVVRDYLYVKDAVEVTLKALHYTGEMRVFNVGSGVGTSVTQLITLMQEITGKQGKIVYRPSRSFDVPANVLDVSRARRELGWVPRTSLLDGIAMTWDWIGRYYNESSYSDI